MCPFRLAETASRYNDNACVLQHLLAVQPLARLVQLLGLLEGSFRQLNGGESIQCPVNGRAADTLELIQDLQSRCSSCRSRDTSSLCWYCTYKIAAQARNNVCKLQCIQSYVQGCLYVEAAETAHERLHDLMHIFLCPSMGGLVVCIHAQIVGVSMLDTRQLMLASYLAVQPAAYIFNHGCTLLQRRKQSLSLFLVQWVGLIPFLQQPTLMLNLLTAEPTKLWYAKLQTLQSWEP